MLRQQLSRHARSASTRVTVWWDSSCPLCTREINFLKRLDKEEKIDFVALDKHAPDTIMIEQCPTSRKELLRRFHAKGDDGKVVSGAAAFALMWRQTSQPQLKWLGEQAQRPSVLWVLERAYRGFLIFRPYLQRLARRSEL